MVRDILNSIAKIEQVCNFAKIIVDNYVKIQNLEKRKYDNIEHIMTQDYEIQTPSNEEIYMFDKRVWMFSVTDRFIVLNKINNNK